jgi:hypothetical protein
VKSRRRVSLRVYYDTTTGQITADRWIEVRRGEFIDNPIHRPLSKSLVCFEQFRSGGVGGDGKSVGGGGGGIPNLTVIKGGKV